MKKLIATLLAVMCIGGSIVSAQTMNLPAANTNVHTYEDYKGLTACNQGALQKDVNVYTTKSGIRAYKDENGDSYFLVALASYYGTEIGSIYQITLENGSTFKVMLGDCKGSDAESTYGHYAWNFRTKENCISVLEFIVDTEELPSKVKNWGTLTALDYFDSNVSSVEYLGRGWYPNTAYHC